MTGPPLIDQAILDDLVESIGIEGTRSVLELFIVEGGLYLKTIVEGAARHEEAGESERVRRAAHALKSGAGQIGAGALAAAAAAVEREAAAAGPSLPGYVAALQQCATRTLDALTRLPAVR